MRQPSRARVSASLLHAGRMKSVRDAMKASKLDGLLITSRVEQFWLTGFTGEDGAVLLTADAVTLLTDGRFAETARIEAPWARSVIRKKRGPETIAHALMQAKLRRVGFDGASMTVSQHAGITGSLKGCRLAALPSPITELRLHKAAEELGTIRRAIRVAQDAFIAVRPMVGPGVSEQQVAARLVYEMQKRGASEPAFVPIVAAGPHSSLPHYEPGDTCIEMNQVLLVDWGARVDWYVSDLTRVIGIGTVPPPVKRIHRVVRRAHDLAIGAARSGIPAGRLDRIAREHIRRAGYGPAFSHSLGHGIGLAVHEGPGLRRAAGTRLRPGMVVTIEPGIYLPGIGGVRIEDDIHITGDGCEVLSSLPIEAL